MHDKKVEKELVYKVMRYLNLIWIKKDYMSQ